MQIFKNRALTFKEPDKEKGLVVCADCDFALARRSLGFSGGGTDLSAYSNRFGGAVLNATIDRYAYAFLEPRDDDQICFDARDIGVHETLSADGPFEGRRWRCTARFITLSSDEARARAR